MAAATESGLVTSYAPAKSTPLWTGVVRLYSWLTGNDATHALAKRHLDKSGIVEVCMVPLLVALSGMFAGLTLGYFSVDPTQLQVLAISGTPKQQKYARLIMPVRKDSHLLLTTLILGNMIVNEALPVVMDGVLGGGIPAVVISTALVVIFAEIIPQSVCSRYGLLIGARMAIPVRCLIYLAYPLAWPIAKLLEYILGAHHGIIYRRSELRELIKMHAAGAEGGGDLDFDTVQITQGALDLARKTVKEAMTPIEQVFMLPIETKLDYETLGIVVKSGHSRIPVYQMVQVPDINLAKPEMGTGEKKMVKKVLGCLLVKSCVLLDPEDATPLASIPINTIPTVSADEPLTHMLNVFQEGRSHMAIVSCRSRLPPPSTIAAEEEDTRSIMTAAAGGLRKRFLRKVAEIGHGKSSDEDSEEDQATDLEKGEKMKSSIRPQTSPGSESSTISPSSSLTVTTEAENIKASALSVSQEKPTKESRKVSSLAHVAKLTQLEQTVPADAQMSSLAVENFFEGLEGAPLGVITLEDVLEELIGEEIYDEYDQRGVPLCAASAFVPPEAALAARKAALARQQMTAVPLPSGNDDHFDPGVKNRAIGRMSLPLGKLGVRKSTSQPGKARRNVASTPNTPPVDDGSKFSGEQITSGDTETIPARGQESQTPVQFDATPNSSLPANVSPTSVPAPVHQSSSLLNEALLIERERKRRLNLSGEGLSFGSGQSRSASVMASANKSGLGTATSPIIYGLASPVMNAISSMANTTTPITENHEQDPAVRSPTPVLKKIPKFKSVPTPISGTLPGSWREKGEES
nr:hypothetical protein L203_03994 [Cryptococcus depauperatus CBS 7841]